MHKGLLRFHYGWSMRMVTCDVGVLRCTRSKKIESVLSAAFRKNFRWRAGQWTLWTLVIMFWLDDAWTRLLRPICVYPNFLMLQFCFCANVGEENFAQISKLTFSDHLYLSLRLQWISYKSPLKSTGKTRQNRDLCVVSSESGELLFNLISLQKVGCFFKKNPKRTHSLRTILERAWLQSLRDVGHKAWNSWVQAGATSSEKW